MGRGMKENILRERGMERAYIMIRIKWNGSVNGGWTFNKKSLAMRTKNWQDLRRKLKTKKNDQLSNKN